MAYLIITMQVTMAYLITMQVTMAYLIITVQVTMAYLIITVHSYSGISDHDAQLQWHI